MPDYLYGVETNVAAASTRVLRYNFSSAAWEIIKTGVPNSLDTTNQGGAWDGFYYYFQAADRKLYRYNPTANTVTVCASGALLPVGSCLVSDGAFVWYSSGFSGTAFGYYDPVFDTLTSQSTPPSAFDDYSQLVWDYGNFLYLICRSSTLANCKCFGFDLRTRTWATLPAPPVAGSAPNGYGGWYAAGKLHWYNEVDKTVYSLTVPGGSSWTQSASGFTTSGGFTKKYSVPLSATLTYVRHYQMWDRANSYFSAVPAAPFAPYNMAFTTNIQTVLSFLEADGVTPQQASEPLGGSAARFFAGQKSPIYTFGVKASYPRSKVTISLVVDPGVDISAGVEIAPSPSGPWSTVANMGSFSAGQVKPYYLRFTVPDPHSGPGTRTFSITGTSE